MTDTDLHSAFTIAHQTIIKGSLEQPHGLNFWHLHSKHSTFRSFGGHGWNKIKINEVSR